VGAEATATQGRVSMFAAGLLALRLRHDLQGFQIERWIDRPIPMSSEIARGYCSRCERAVAVTRPGVNHVLHLLLSIITSGIWLIVWFLVSILHIGGWRCSACGSSHVSAGFWAGRAEAAATRRIAKRDVGWVPIEAPTKECPYCAETIKAKATVCKHCLRELPPPQLEIEAASPPIPQEEIRPKRDLEPYVYIAVIVVAILAAVVAAIFKR